MTEDEMVGWYHRLNGHEFEQALGVGDGQGSLVCCSPWGHKESDMTEQLNWTDPKDVYIQVPRTCGHVPLHGKRDFADVIKSWLWDGKITLAYPVGPNVVIKVLRSRRAL